MPAPQSFFSSKNRVLWAWLGGAVLGIFLVGLIFFFTNRKAYFVDGFGIREETEAVAVRQILWEKPELLEGLESIDDELYDPTFGADGSTLIFNMGRPGKDGGADLYRAENPLNNGWSKPQPLGSLNGPENEIGASLSADGSHLFFYSDREGGFGGYDIWFSKLDGQQWSDPVNAGSEVNTAFNEYDPAYDPYNDTLYFASNRPKRELTEEEKRAWLATQRELIFSTDYDIFTATRVPRVESKEGGKPVIPTPESSTIFQPSQRVAYLNTTDHEGQICLTPRGEFIYFASNRPGGEGGFDIYRARIIDGGFRDLENIGRPVNSPHDEMDPALSHHGYVLVLSSNQPRPTEGDVSTGPAIFTLYESTSREVFVQIEQSAWEAFTGFLKRNFWWILLLLAALVGIIYLFRLLRSKDIELGMTTRALLGSLLFHAVFALLLSLWFLTYQIIESAKDPIMEADLDTDALAQEKLALQIREKVTEMLPAVEETIPVQQVRPDMPVPNFEPEETPVIDPPPEAFIVKHVPVEVRHELPEPVRRDLPQAELPAPKLPEIQELSANTPRFKMEIPEVQADNSNQPQFQQVQDTNQQVQKADAPIPDTEAQPTPVPNIEVAQANLPQSVSAIQEVRANPALPTLPEPVLPKLDTAPNVPELAFNTPTDLKLESDHNVETESAPEFEKVSSNEVLADVQPIENAIAEEEPVQAVGRAVQEQHAPQEKSPIFEAKIASVESDKPIDNLPSFESQPDLFEDIPSLQTNMKLESERDLQAEEGGPILETFNKDTNVAKAVELVNAEQRPELPELKIIQSGDAPKEAPADLKVEVQSEARPVEDQLTAFKDSPELLTTPISQLVAGIQLEGERDIQAEDGAPEVEKVNKDANVAKAVELVNAEQRPELPELKITQSGDAPKEAPADLKVEVQSEARPVEDQLIAFKDSPELLTAPISLLFAGIQLDGERDIQAEDGAPEVEKVNKDANVAKAAALKIDEALPEDTAREVAAHDLPTNKKAKPLINIKPLDYQPSLPDLSGPDLQIAAHLPTVALSTKLLLETQPADQEPYLLRDPKMREKVLERLGGNEDTEKAVVRALDWFTKHQEKDGRWSMKRHGGQNNHDFAATSFAVLCYFGWGIKHNEPSKYQKPVQKAIKWLVGDMGKNGDFTNGQHNGMYDQGVATMALAEAYGLTKDPDLKEPLERAVRFIIEAQNQNHGAWDYRPKSNRIDTSVSGWQIMALRSARMAGIKIEDRPFQLAAKWLDTIGAGQNRGLYGYDSRKLKSDAMVAEGLFAQQLLGTPPSHARMQESIKHIARKLPKKGQRNFYYWYYGCLSLYQNQGPVWEEWNARIKPLWLDLQVKNGANAGSWDAKGGNHMGEMGRVITTALATLSLEVYYRYLPLYQERAITLTLRE